MTARDNDSGCPFSLLTFLALGVPLALGQDHYFISTALYQSQASDYQNLAVFRASFAVNIVPELFH